MLNKKKYKKLVRRYKNKGDYSMELKEIKKHWETLAEKYAEDLKSTTKTSTIKKLEINAIQNTIKQIINIVGNVNILEVGCGMVIIY